MSTKEDQEGRGAVVLGVVVVCLVIAAGFAADAHHYWSAAAYRALALKRVAEGV